MLPIDLTGQVFGRLTAIHVAETGGNERIWLCACICGGNKLATTSHLRKGFVQSCGCMLGESSHARININNLWKRVVKTDKCWVWTGTTIEGGYGRFTYSGKTWLAHRLAWTIGRGPIPDGMLVLHHCDNPPCVNYERCLFLGTDQDNTDDKMAKGRDNPTIGEAHPNSKLTASIVTEIRKRFLQNTDLSKELIGAEYGVTHGAVRGLLNGYTWKHLPWPK